MYSPIFLENLTDTIDQEKDKHIFKIKNSGTPVKGGFKLKGVPTPIYKKIIPYKKGVGYEFTYSVSKKGNYSISAKKRDDSFQYARIRCYQKVNDQIYEQGNVVFEEISEPVKVKVSCYTFDFFNNREKGDDLVFEINPYEDNSVHTPGNVTIGKGRTKEIAFTKKWDNVGKFKLYFTPEDGSKELFLGEVEGL